MLLEKKDLNVIIVFVPQVGLWKALWASLYDDGHLLGLELDLMKTYITAQTIQYFEKDFGDVLLFIHVPVDEFTV